MRHYQLSNCEPIPRPGADLGRQLAARSRRRGIASASTRHRPAPMLSPGDRVRADNLLQLLLSLSLDERPIGAAREPSTVASRPQSELVLVTPATCYAAGRQRQTTGSCSIHSLGRPAGRPHDKQHQLAARTTCQRDRPVIRRLISRSPPPPSEALVATGSARGTSPRGVRRAVRRGTVGRLFSSSSSSPRPPPSSSFPYPVPPSSS